MSNRAFYKDMPSKCEVKYDEFGNALLTREKMRPQERARLNHTRYNRNLADTIAKNSSEEFVDGGAF